MFGRKIADTLIALAVAIIIVPALHRAHAFPIPGRNIADPCFQTPREPA